MFLSKHKMKGVRKKVVGGGGVGCIVSIGDMLESGGQLLKIEIYFLI